mmetsp:Transcript_724/g.1899  ORF Transcript_724/g.1899 Transcript_724/m.1899 type:complete len:109 (+) Transcript_724:1917-2243(+)
MSEDLTASVQCARCTALYCLAQCTRRSSQAASQSSRVGLHTPLPQHIDQSAHRRSARERAQLTAPADATSMHNHPSTPQQSMVTPWQTAAVTLQNPDSQGSHQPIAHR